MKATAYLFLAGLFALATSCSHDDDPNFPALNSMKELKAPHSFEYRTTGNVALSVVVQNVHSRLSGVPVMVYLDHPGSPDEPAPDARKLGTYASNEAGIIEVTLKVPLTTGKLYLKTNYIGLESLVEIPLVGNSATYVYGSAASTLKVGYSKDPQDRSLKAGVTYTYLGSYSNTGVPEYLVTPRDEITQSFLEDLNATLPESKKLPQSHPEYLAKGNEADIVLKEEADIWITFVHEGAGYLNALGYYVYNKENPPKSIQEIKQHRVVFPNVSFSGSGGGLRSGDKVFLGRFKAGEALGWFLVPNGWSNGKVSGSKIYYSEPSFNPEKADDKKQHTVLVYDAKRGRLLLGFEDMNREGGSDDDFNDAVFYVTANPVKAVDVSRVPPMDTPSDRDKDGISDIFDDYPDDPSLAFDYFYPAEGKFGSIVVEDLWPGLGDFDFNDLVVDFNFNQKADPKNRVKEMTIQLKTRAIGASFRNGFGFQLAVSPEMVESVKGNNLKGEYIKLESNGVESNQSKAVIIAFEDAYDVLRYGGSGTGVNVLPEKDYTEPSVQSIEVVFSKPLSLSELGEAPYNPFLIVDGNREREIHLSGYQPTELVNRVYFGQSQDATDPSKGWFYRTQNNLVWMLELPSSFEYMIERQDLLKGYTKFASWAISGGTRDADWYENKPNYRVEKLLYKR